MVNVYYQKNIAATPKELCDTLLDHQNLSDFFNASFKVLKAENDNEISGGKGCVREVTILGVRFKEEIVHGKPWLNREANKDRKHHFLLKDLEDYLQKKKFTAYNRTKLTRILRNELDGEKESLRVQKQDGQEAVIKVWTIPEFEDDMVGIQSNIPDMKDKKSYE